MPLCASVYVCFMVTCWKRADLLALVCGVYCEFVISMGTYCASLVADLSLFCYERDFMMYLSDDKQADVIDALTLHPDIWTISYTLIMFI